MKFSLRSVYTLSALTIAALLPGMASALTVTALTDAPGSASDPFINLTHVSATNFLQITASGQVFLQDGPQYGVNAAGVIITPGNFGSTGGVGDSNNFSMAPGECPIASCTFGALLATLTLPGDGLSETVQVFQPTPASSPPSSLTYTGTWGGLFGNFATTTGGSLTFSIADTDYSDNSGAFNVTAIPEPGTWLLLVSGVGLSGLLLRFGRRAREVGLRLR